MMVKDIKIGWKQLNKILQGIGDAINHNQPLQGYGITLSEGAKGTIISLEKGENATGTTAQTQSQIPGYFWLTIYGVAYKQVTIVDPATCAQTNANVLCRNEPDEPGYDPTYSGIKFQVFIDVPDPNWINPI